MKKNTEYRWKKWPEEKPEENYIPVIIWPHIQKAEYFDGWFHSVNGGCVFTGVKYWIERRALPLPTSGKWTVTMEGPSE